MKYVLLPCLALLLPCSCAATAPEHLEAKGALGPYSALVRSGELVFVSGRIGATKADFPEEVATTIGAVEVELRRVGLELADVVMVTAYLTDMSLYEAFNTVYGQRFPAPYPARATVGVQALPAGARVEIAAIARAR